MKREHDELEIDSDATFHRHNWTAQRIGAVGMILFVLASVAGLLGPGLVGKTTTGHDWQFLVTYDRFLHYQSPAELKIQITPGKSEQSNVRLAINHTYINSIEISRIDPEPESEESAGDEVVYTFKVPSSGDRLNVSFYFEATTFGQLPARIQSGDYPAVSLKQFVYP